MRHERQLQQYGNGRLPPRSGTPQNGAFKAPTHRNGRYSFSEDGSAWSDVHDDVRETPSKDAPGERAYSVIEEGRDHSPELREARMRGNSGGAFRESSRLELDDREDFDDSLELDTRRPPRSRASSITAGKQSVGSASFAINGLQSQELPIAMASPAVMSRPQRPRQSSYVMASTMQSGNVEPLVDDQTFGLSPSSTDEFTTWLFNGQGINPGYSVYPGNSLALGGYANNFGQICPDYGQTGMLGSSFGDQMNLWLQPEAIGFPGTVEDGTSQLGKTGLSEQKRQSLLQYIRQRFNEIGSQGTKSAADIKNEIFGSDTDADTYVLSLVNMQKYISSYFENFHDQLPILHRPTFRAEHTHDFLLLAVLIMGASMLAKKRACSEDREKICKFTNFVSWNLRWQVFMHADSHPPAKLWVIQTLLILEVYEKLNATRVLHERAHIYFPTTLSLMRRGSALTGKQSSYVSRAPSPLGSPELEASASSRLREEKKAVNYSTSPEKWWDHWIAQEATRRAAFAAFILDATHAAMFGHTPTLVIHEIKLPLPCDNTLWSSESPSEIGCVESSLHANGVTPISFLEGLKRILNGQRVHTSPFGRIAILAALLSVTWQMHQRDLDRSTLGNDTMPGVQERWRPKLLKALDWWKKDYDDGVAHVRHAAFDWQKIGLSSRGGSDDGEAFQSLGTLLHHMGHMSVHISMPELCIFVGITHILGRSVSSADYKRTAVKIKEWGSSSGSIGGVYHALKLIKLILGIDDLEYSARFSRPSFGGNQQTQRNHQASIIPEYDACNDNLLNRAWGLYYASLLVWAYGYVQDGTLDAFPDNLQYPPRESAAGPTATNPGFLAPPTASQGPNTPDASLVSPSVREPPVMNIDAVELARKRHEDLRSYLQMMLPPHVDSVQAFQQHQQQVGVDGSRNKVIGLLSVVDKALSGSTWELLAEARIRLKMAARRLKPDDVNPTDKLH